VANTKSAIKRIKQNEKRRQRNRATRSTIRSAVKAAADAKLPESKVAVTEAIRRLDRAVSRGVMHRNTVARKKSALARKLNTLA
jgi:small subunit ribosomal protein S20